MFLCPCGHDDGNSSTVVPFSPRLMLTIGIIAQRRCSHNMAQHIYFMRSLRRNNVIFTVIRSILTGAGMKNILMAIYRTASLCYTIAVKEHGENHDLGGAV